MSTNCIELNPIRPDVGGWLQGKLNETAMKKLWEYIKTGGPNSRERLAGNISSSFRIEDVDNWFWKNVLEDIVLNYETLYNPALKTTNYHSVPYCLLDFWANKSKKTEFNPLHDHAGVYSFVIWMKIPTDYREQHNLPHVRGTNSPSASDFAFVYHDILGKTRTKHYLLDKDSEGTILFFPSQGMGHMVYPFFESDEERVTISGNLFYDTRQAQFAPIISV
jgi:hypothetical protein